MKFNVKAITAKLLNHEGETAFALTPQMELYTMVAVSALNDQFYENAEDKLKRLRKLIEKNEAAFVARLAVYAREQMHLRTIPLVLVVELGKVHRGDGVVAKLVARVIQRADEITELLAYYQLANKRTQVKKLNKLSKQLQKGLAASFNKFDEYQFAKYDRANQVKLRDALFLVHPKAKDDAQQVIFDKIVKNELKTPYTWEVELSALGQLAFNTEAVRSKAFKEKWEEMIFSNKLGYMATLRNLRNFLEAGISNEALNKVCSYLSDGKAVTSSRQLPFRFLSAYRELKDVKDGRVGNILEALEAAILCSALNIPGYDDNTRVVVAADVSGSMQAAISPKSKVQYFDIGLVLAMLLRSRCRNVITGMFGNTWKTINVPKNNILSNVEEFRRREGEVGYSTNGYLVIQQLLNDSQIVDKVMMFTDCQLWNSNNNGYHINTLWKSYKKLAPQAKLYLFDLAGHGQSPLQLEKNDVYLVAGWSDKIFHALQAIEEGGNAIKRIENLNL
ncbi:TROVE domain-containing protein [Flavitalea sp. BT771]|uniref:TROVE domain-containing protein n=1 Tax=Flavitalea sp. BT771 TaxID=3063329 RepID=UPI0026E46ABB|nr:TROVE domain-containing protein [Flavitalea sp. BT771]MDO6433700.1 TROVE domain-containing protein [Flavitalea sp. BT771]MDV6222395.1 TROVE domain-containing protein [Flavitalea sp. BT771]